MSKPHPLRLIPLIPIILACSLTATIPQPATTLQPAGETPGVPPGQTKNPTPPARASPTPLTCITVTANALHIRASPSSDANITGYLTRGDTITITHPITATWTHIPDGWINTHYTRTQPCRKK